MSVMGVPFIEQQQMSSLIRQCFDWDWRKAIEGIDFQIISKIELFLGFHVRDIYENIWGY